MVNVLFWNSGLGLLLLLLPLCGQFYLIYYLLSLPLRRQERARFFLDLIETGLKEGRSVEDTIISAGRAGDPSLGARFHLIAAYLESGLTFEQALAKTPYFLPQPIVAMLKVGMETGQLETVLPACRQRLTEGSGQLLKAQNYLALVGLTISPVWVAVFTVLTVFVFPKYLAIAADIEDLDSSATELLRWLMAHKEMIITVQNVVVIGFYAAVLVYVAGPRVRSLFARIAPTLHARLALSLPWRRKRIQRDFSALLAVLLDAQVSEAAAILLAAESSGNSLFKQRAAAVAEDLRQGAKLTEAVQRLDAEGEFCWRLANAARARGSFLTALTGWHEGLSAHAYRQEQTFAQLLTTGLVLFNGLLVGALALAVFHILISIQNAGILW